MQKRGQATSTLVLYVLAVIVIGAMLYFGLEWIGQVKGIQKTVEGDDFSIKLQNNIESQRKKPYGSVDHFKLSLPKGVNKVCFVDDSEQFSKQTSLELTNEKSFYKDKNLFFFPSGKIEPLVLRNIKLEEENNPLCLKSSGAPLNLKLTALSDLTLLESNVVEENQKDCRLVSGNTLTQEIDKLDIVFLGFGYDNSDDFFNEVSEYTTDYLLEIEPFKSNQDKINVWAIDKEEPECSVSSYIFCDTFSVNKIASICPNDNIFILANKDEVSSRIRSSAISNMAKINTRDNKLVLVHEFGHSFGGLADEYTDSYYDDWFDAKDYPNCDVLGCKSWQDIPSTSCIRGCSTTGYYRSSEVSIMKDYTKTSNYGILNEKIIKEKLEVYE